MYQDYLIYKVGERRERRNPITTHIIRKSI